MHTGISLSCEVKAQTSWQLNDPLVDLVAIQNVQGGPKMAQFFVRLNFIKY